MKKALLIAVLAFSFHTFFAQTTIWSENFNSYSNGTIVGSGTPPKWTRTTASQSGHFLVQSYQMEGYNLKVENVWASQIINITQFSNVKLSLNYSGISTTGDYINVYYKLDNGSEIPFSSNGITTGSAGTFTNRIASQVGLNGNNVQIIIRLKNDKKGNADAYYSFDNVLVEGIIPPCAKVSSFPYHQNFDSWTVSNTGSRCTADGTVDLQQCWTNATGDDIDWDINSGTTPTSGTGPSGDHTTGGGKYLYTEASGGGVCNNSLGIVTTPIFDFSGVVNPELSFWYHMNGTDMGTLNVQVSANGGATWSGNLWSLSGNQPNAWREAAAISLLSYAGNSNVQIRFSGRTGNGFSSDIALDDFSIVDAPIPSVLTVSDLNDFGMHCANTTAGPESFTITGSQLTTQNVTVAALTGFTYSTTAGGPYAASLSLSQIGGTFSRVIYVRFNPVVAGSHNGNISVGGGGAPSVNVAATAGANAAPSAASSAFPLNGATGVCYAGGGAVSSMAWDAVPGATSYDVYFSPGSMPTSVTQNVTGTAYTAIPLAASTTYYWKVVPKNSCGDATGVANWSFTTASTSCSDNYCPITFAEVRSITRVAIGTIDNYSSPLTGSPSYENYTSLSTDLSAGGAQTITLEGFTNGNNQFYYTVFFDWNQDGDFNDPGESYNIGTITNSTGTDGKVTTAVINVPTNAVAGPTIMRVIGSYNSFNSDPCVAYSAQGQIEDYSVNVIPCVAGNPSVFGDNQWNVYAYNGNNLDLSGIIYAGYYTEPNLTFDSKDRWGEMLSPSSASGYQGCIVANDNHTVVYKRSNFICGIYQIDVTSHEDAARLYIDGVQVFEHIGGSDFHDNIWTGKLDANSTVEFRVVEQSGASNGALTFTLIPAIAEFSSNTQVVQNGGVVNFTNTSYGQNAPYLWTFTPSTVTFLNGTNASSSNPQVQFNGLGAYNVALLITDTCGATFTKSSPNYILVSNETVFDADGTFIVPCGITSINVKAWGGGGAGGGSRSTGNSSNINSGAGGSGGAYASNSIAVTPGAILTIDVAGSVSGVNDGNGANGNHSTILGFESQIWAAGGLGGLANATTTSPSGAGFAGANGGGSGGTGVVPISDGNNGIVPGGGGSGSSTKGGPGTPPSRTGGRGAGGRIILSWDLEIIPPTVVTKDFSVQLDASGNATISTSNIDDGSFDSCSAVTLTLDNTSFNCSNVGANTVTLTATDAVGNVASATAQVTVNEVIPAQVITQNISIDLDANGDASIIAAQVDNGSNDACGIASMTVVPNTFDCSNIGANTVTLTLTDVNGNVSSATATVTVNDVTLAQVITQDISIDLDANGDASIIAAQVDNGSNDACGIASMTVVPITFDCSNIGANTVTLTVVDNNGNSSSATATVTVNDVTVAQVVT
ncbi:GEVED domain-containing protein, partial [Gelidibacter gilvus]